MTSAPVRVAKATIDSTTALDGAPGGAALDQAQVDLDDVEAQVAQQPQARVAGAQVVGGKAHPRGAAGVELVADLLDVADRLVLGQLDHQPLRREAVAGQDAEHARRR